MAQVIIGLGGVALFAYAVYLLVRTVSATRLVLPFDLMLLAIGAIGIVGGVVFDAAHDGFWDREEWIALGFTLVLLVAGAAAGLINLTRREKRTGPRGLLAVIVGLLLVVITAAAPAIATRATLDDDLAVLPALTPGATPSSTLSSMERARGIFDQVTDLIAAETGLDPAVVATNLDTGLSVAEMVRESDGDLELVIQQITEILTAQVQELAASGRMNDLQASLAISQMENIVRIGVETDLTGALARFEETPQIEATSEATPG